MVSDGGKREFVFAVCFNAAVKYLAASEIMPVAVAFVVVICEVTKRQFLLSEMNWWKGFKFDCNNNILD